MNSSFLVFTTYVRRTKYEVLRIYTKMLNTINTE